MCKIKRILLLIRQTNLEEEKKMDHKGQGALEYLLLIGGAVLIATIVLLIIIGSTGSTNNIINGNLNTFTHALDNAANLP